MANEIDQRLPQDLFLRSTGAAEVYGPWVIRRIVRQHAKFGVDLIKTCSTGGVLSKGTALGATQYTLEELTALVEEAHAARFFTGS